VNFAHVRRGGPYYRVVDPTWQDPSDTSYSRRAGGRWNEPDRPGRPGFGALYLNATLEVARANAARHIASQFGPSITFDDFAAGALPQLQYYDIVETDFVDAVSSIAINGLGLAASYPREIPHPPCQGIAAAAYANDEHGIAVLSAVGRTPTDEELVVFDRDVHAIAGKGQRVDFSDWY
jgi:RES domain-containing protein